MDRKQIPVLHFLLLTIFSVSFSAPVQYQTFLFTPLPKTLKPQTLSWPTQIQSSEPESTPSLGLYHVDNLYRPVDSTPVSLLELRLLRDAARFKSLSAAAAAGFSSSVSGGSGEYLTRIGVGTPANNLYMLLDTGSDVVWLQCSPCRKCYNQTDPVFDPKKSTSFESVNCSAPLCLLLRSPQCNSTSNECLYSVKYGDGSFTSGGLSTETLTFGTTTVPNIALGCGHDNEGLFDGAAAGLLGLGRGKLAFPTQAVGQFGTNFSYCLGGSSGSLMFGESAIPENSKFTPLLTNPKMETFYYVELNGVSVGGARVSGINASLFELDTTGKGGVIVDSGTSVSRLNQPAYLALRDAFLGAGASNLTRASSFSLFDTCFDLSGIEKVSVPKVELHFNGADLDLPATNFLVPVDSNGTVCFAFTGTRSGLSIIGNIQQQGFRVGFDLANKRVGFAPNGCA